MTIEFLIASHGHLPGVRLTMFGHYANIPFPSDEAAAAEAHVLAKGKPYNIRRETFPAQRPYRRNDDAHA